MEASSALLFHAAAGADPVHARVALGLAAFAAAASAFVIAGADAWPLVACAVMLPLASAAVQLAADA